MNGTETHAPLDLEAIEARINTALRNRAWADTYIEYAAHQDLPALVAEVRRLRAILEDIKRYMGWRTDER